MLVRIAKRLNPDLGLHCLPLHFWQKINAWKLSTFTINNVFFKYGMYEIDGI